MLSGEKPFNGENITALMYAITHNTYTPLPQVAPAAPACCVKIIDKLLQKGVTRRHRSAGQLTEQIKKCQQELGNHSVPSQK